ncbi:unnamed protein product, partial [Urochloa humidicola]
EVKSEILSVFDIHAVSFQFFTLDMVIDEWDASMLGEAVHPGNKNVWTANTMI